MQLKYHTLCGMSGYVGSPTDIETGNACRGGNESLLPPLERASNSPNNVGVYSSGHVCH